MTRQKFSLENVGPADEDLLHKGVFIVLLHALRVPPHLFLSVNGSVYSLSVHGQHVDEPIEKYLELVHRKRIPSLFVEWEFSGNIPASELKNEIKRNVRKYKRVDSNVSCLFPIRDTAANFFGDEMKKASFIFELLPLLQKKNSLGKSYSYFLEQQISQGGKFELQTYSAKQLYDSIAEKQKAKTTGTH